MGTNKHKVYAVTDGDGVGIQACWDLSGLTYAKTLAEALEDFAGIDIERAPKPWEPQRVFRNACHDAVRGEPNYMCDKHPSQSGYVFVARKTEDEEPIYSATCRGYLVDDKPEATHPDHPMWPKVIERYTKRLGKIDPTGLNTWLVRYLRANCDALPYLRKGGLYYIPSWKREHYMDVVKAIRTCSEHELHAGAAMSDVETLRSICTSLTRECETTMDDIRKDIAKGENLKRNIRTMSKLDQRLEAYADMLGTSLDDVLPRLEEVKLELTQSQLDSQQSDEKKN